MSKKFKIVIFTLLGFVLLYVAIFAAQIFQAYYSSLPRVYTSDDDSGQIARIGMRIDLLFDRLDPENAPTSYTYPGDDSPTVFRLNGSENPAEWGTKENPYIISMPRHLLNLYALQKAGYFYDRFISDNYDNGVYNEGTSMPYFMVCETDGTPVTIDGSRITNGINPIGTEAYPFIGYVGGAIASGTTTYNGKTSITSAITDVTVNAREDEIDVGLFGKISYLGDISTVDENNNFKGAISTIDNLLLCDVKIVSKSTTLAERIAEHIWGDSVFDETKQFEDDHHVGILAGHIEYAAVTNISVYYSNTDETAIDVDQAGANYYSDSGFIGLVYNLNPEVAGNAIGTNSGTTIAGSTSGSGEEWGGSIPMKDIFTRLRSIEALSSTVTQQYVSAETVTINEVTGETTAEATAYTNYPNSISSSDDSSNPVYYQSEDIGSFLFAEYNNTYAMFLGKSATFFPKTVTTYRYLDEFEDALLIDYNGTYLNNNGTNLSTGNNADTATKWVIDSNNHLNCLVEQTNAITKYYLNASNTGVLSLSTTGTTSWTYDAVNDRLTYQSGGKTWYLIYDGGFKGYPFAETFTIYNGTTYFGRNNSTTNFVGTNANYANWYYEDGKLMTFYSNSIYYLNANNSTLSLSTTVTTTNWVKDSDTIHCNQNGFDWYLRLNNGSWSLFPAANAYKIHSGTSYLSYNGSIQYTTEANASAWAIDNNNRFYTVYNNDVYYLVGDVANTVLTVTTTAGSATQFNYTLGGGQITFTNNTTTYYMYVINNVWRCFPSTSVSLISIDGNYLTYNNTTTVRGDTLANASVWLTDDSNHIYTINNGTKYYLTASDASVSLSTVALTVWTHDTTNNTLSHTSSGRTWYLIYDNGFKCYPFEETFTIYNGTTYLGRSDSNSNLVGTNANHANWYYEDGKLMMFYNNSIYYLNADNSTLSLSTVAITTDWAFNGNKLYRNSGGIDWYLRLNNGAWSLFPAETAYKIHSGTSYLSYNESIQYTTEANASAWAIDNNNRFYTVYNDRIYYLVGDVSNRVLTVTTTAGSATQFNYTLGGGQITFTNNATTYYMYVIDGIWRCIPAASMMKISNNGTYLTYNNTTTVRGDTSANGSTWLMDSSNYLYTINNNTNYYLNASGTTVSLSTTASTVWTYDGNNRLTYQYNNETWYLLYDTSKSSWVCYPSLNYILINNGTHYLTNDGTLNVADTTSSALAARWFVEGSKYYILSGSTKYYLMATNLVIQLTTNPSSATSFTYNSTDGELSFEYSNNTYYIIYNNGWKVMETPAVETYISSGGVYLNASTTGVLSSTTATTKWLYSNNQFYTVIGGTKYYLQAALEQNNRRSSTNLTVTTNPSDATTFTYTSNHLSCSLNGDTYTIALDNNKLKLVNTLKTYYTIYGGNNYLNLNGTTFAGGSGTSAADDATLWEFSDATVPSRNNRGTTTTISSLVNGTANYISLTRSGSGGWFSSYTYHLNLTTTSTYSSYFRTNSGYSIRGSNSALRYNSGWGADENNNATMITRTAVTFTAANITLADPYPPTVEDSYTYNATINYSDIQTPSNYTFNNLSTEFNHTKSTPVNLDAVLYENQTPATYSFNGLSGEFSHTVTNNVAEDLDVTYSNQTPSSYSFNNLSSEFTHTIDDSTSLLVNLTPTRRQNYTKTVENNQPGGHDSYFPLSADSSTYAVKQDNTGYVVGGSYASYQAASGDVRVASAYAFNGRTSRNTPYYLQYAVNGSTYRTNNMEVLTRTYLSNGLKRISDTYNVNNNSVNSNISGRTKVDRNTLGLQKYDSARSQLDDMFMLQDNGTRRTSYTGSIYGMHFMDSVISMDHLITAPKVVINGKTYYNYEMPEDSINFRLKSKGFINFFAGTYYVNSGHENNSFFSLSEIVRDANHKITDIKRILKIYGNPNVPKAAYIYDYADDNITEQQVIDSLPTGYVEMFDCAWIESPDMIYYSVYYFEIPVNSGEYALGSVAGKYGAYLMYLDIGASAATHNSALGSIDFVYDYNNSKIVTVTDTSDTVFTNEYYKESLIILYTRNTDKDGSNNFVDIENFTIKVRRTVTGSDDTPTTTVIFAGDNNTNLSAISQAPGFGDALAVTGGTSG